MKLYNTKFKLKDEYSVVDVVNVFRSWIVERGYINIPKYENSLDIVANEGKNEYRTLFLQEKKILAGKFSTTNKGVEWTTTFTFNDETKFLTIALDKKKEDASVLLDTRFSIPRFATEIIKYANDDAGLPVTTEPLELNKDMIDKVAPIITGEKATNLPVILMSMKDNGEIPADPGFIANDLQGTAHIVVSLDTEDDMRLLDATRGRYKKNGIISIYFAGNKIPAIFSPDDMSSQAFRYKIRNTIYGRTRVEYRAPLETWSGVLEASANSKENDQSAQIKAYEEQIKKMKEDNETWMNLVDEETNRYSQEIEKLNNDCRTKEREIMMLQAKLDAKENLDDAILFAGDIEEFFPNEQREFVISALQEASKNVIKDSRRMHVLQSVIDANKSDGTLDKLQAKIDTIFSGMKTLGEREKRGLEEVGFKVKHKGEHYKLYYHEDERYVVVMGVTPSDIRAMKNNRRNLIKKVL